LLAGTLHGAAQAQSASGAFASAEAAARHRAGFAAAVRKAGLKRPADGYYYKYRIDVTREAALRRAGVDLRELERFIRIDGPGSYQESSLYADVVVRGTVLSIVTDSSRRVCYHSTFRVRVAEVWQGQPTDTITVRLANGPLGTGRVHFGETANLHVGEDVVLHASYVDFAQFAEVKKLGLNTCANNAAPGDFTVLLATPLRGNEVLSGDGLRPVAKLADLRRNLRHLAAILDKEHFYQKVF